MQNNRYEFIIATIKQAGELLLQALEENIEVKIKDNDIRNPVTDVDIKVSNFISQEITKSFPDEVIYSEEAADVDISSGTYWSIDPIDGTSHFSRGIPHFAVVISHVDQGVPVFGAIYNPVTRELFSFEKGKGAFLNDKLVKVSNITDLSLAHVFLRIGRNPELVNWGLNAYKFLLANANKTSNFGSSALDMCFVGAGRLEACIYGTMTSIDIAAAIGFVREAGGLIVDQNGANIVSLSKNRQLVMAVNNPQMLSALKLTT